MLLHGAFEDSRCWGRQLDGLSYEFTVIALDAPGFGASDDPPPTWTTADVFDPGFPADLMARGRVSRVSLRSVDCVREFIAPLSSARGHIG